MKKSFFKINLFMAVGLLVTDSLYRFAGYGISLYMTVSAWLGKSPEWVSVNELFGLMYFEDSFSAFSILSTVVFIVASGVTAAIYRDYLSGRTLLAIGMGALLPFVIPQIAPAEETGVFSVILTSIGAAVLLAYMIVLIVFTAEDISRLD